MIFHDIPQQTPEWFALRSGMPTASEAHRLVTPTGKASEGLELYAQQLAADLYRGKPADAWSGNEHTDRGNELEPVAADNYEFMYNAKLRKVGFITDDNNSYGVSPDRLVGRSGLVEIKCLDDKAHIAALVHYTEKRKAPPERIAQCQMQLFTTGKKFNDLFYFNKNLPSFKIRILPIKLYFEMLECQLEDVIERRDVILKLLRSM